MGSKSTELIGANKGHDDTKHTAADADHSESPLRSQVDAALAGPPKAETAKADAPKEAPKPKDASDKTTDTAQANGEPDDPLLHAGKVNAIKQDLDAIARSGKTGDDVLQIGDRQMKVKDVVTELKKTLRTELEQAKTAAAAINQETVQAMLNGNISDRNNLAKELGLNPNLLTKEVIDAERAKAGSDPARRQKIDELDLNLQDRVEMEKLRHAPAFVKLVEAEMVAKGYDNPNLALGDKIPAEAQGRAFDLMKRAGQEDPDLKVSDVYTQYEQSIGMNFAASQQQRSQEIIQLMTAATQAEKTGQPQTVVIDGQTKQLGQFDLLKEANRLADQVNVGWLASQAVLPRNLENQTSEEMMNIVYVSSHARLDMVKYMSEHGQLNEAQSIFNKVKTDTPELIYDEKGGYRDQSMQALDTKLTMGSSNDGGDYQTTQTKFLAALEKGDIYRDSSKPGQSAGELLDQMKQQNVKAKQEMEAADKVLQNDKQNLLKQQQELEKKQNLSDEEKIDLERTKREIQVIDNTMQQRHAFMDRRENLTTYLEANWYEAKEDYSKANSLYKQFQNGEHDDALKKQLNLEDKIGKTEPGFSGWWNRNWGYVAVGASIVVAAGLTIGTLGLGSAAGAGLVATAITATAVGTGGAALTHWGIERTVNKDAGWESAWKGAKIGFMTSSMIVAPWASGARAAGTAAATEGVGALGTTANVAASTSRIGAIANGTRTFVAENAAKIGLTKTSMAYGFGSSAVTTAGDVALGLTPADQAAKQFAMQGLMNSAFFGMSAKWGEAAKLASTSQSAAKTSITEALGMSKVTAIGGYGYSGVVETANYLNGTKSGTEALGDFAKGGTTNFLVLSAAAKLGLSDKVGYYANQNVQNLRYGIQAVGMQESVTAAVDLGRVRFNHDILGKGDLLRDPGVSNTLPLLADTYWSTFGGGLNDRHRGEAKRIGSNADYLGPAFNATISVDQRPVDAASVNRQGIFFNVDDIIRRERELQQQGQ
ncbi:hypothetical protein KF707_06815 [Candidatus Obscuribacterales bacterium]|nr:hypothetical protein [Candidatus Obscuribacterales bacterium]